MTELSLGEILKKYMVRYGAAHNTAFTEIDPHNPKHGGSNEGMSKVFDRTPEIEKEVLAEALHSLQVKQREARQEAIASYKKINDKLESEIRIDELKWAKKCFVFPNPNDRKVFELAINFRIKQLKKGI